MRLQQGKAPGWMRFKPFYQREAVAALPLDPTPDDPPSSLLDRLRAEIQHREQLETALDLARSEFRTLMETVPDVIFSLEFDGRIAMINSAFETITGWRVDEFIGQPMEALLHPDDQTMARSRHEQLLAGEAVPVYELRIRTRAGGYLVGEFNVTIVRCGEKVAVLGIARDVTQRRQVQGLLHDQLRFERVVASISVQFLRRSPEVSDGAVEESLHQIGGFFDADGMGFGVSSIETGTFERTHTWLRDKEQAGYFAEQFRVVRLPNLLKHLVKQRELVFHRLPEILAWPDELAFFEALGSQAAVIVPLDIQPQSLTWIGVISKSPRDWQPDSVWRLQFLGQLLASVICRERAEQRMQAEQELLRKLLEIQERERQLIAHEIHDGFLQYALAAHMHLQAARKGIGDEDAERYPELGKASQALKLATSDARHLLSELRSVVLDRQGAVRAVGDLIAEFNLHAGLSVAYTNRTKFQRLDPMLENTIYRIVQEGLNNVKRHGQTTEAVVRLTQNGDWLQIEIRDHGRGFDPAQVSANCFGLIGIRERARLLGGRATIESAPGKGTLIDVHLPLNLASSAPPPAGSGP